MLLLVHPLISLSRIGARIKETLDDGRDTQRNSKEEQVVCQSQEEQGRQGVGGVQGSAKQGHPHDKGRQERVSDEQSRSGILMTSNFISLYLSF